MSDSGLNYGQGTWFCVPLRSGGFAVGLVARVSPGGGVLFGYFWGPVLEKAPTLAEVSERTPGDAVLVCRFGDLSLQEGTWQVIGQTQVSPDAWPVPAFVRRDELANIAFKVEYDDSDPNVVVSETKIDEQAAEALEPDRVCGAGAVELILTHLLP